MSIYPLNSTASSSMALPAVAFISTTAALAYLIKKICNWVYHKFFSIASKESMEAPRHQPAALPQTTPVSFLPSQLFKGKSPPLLALWDSFKKTLSQRAPFTLVGIDGIEREVSLLGYLGRGMNKYAFDIGNGNALLLPNMDDCPLVDIQKRWEPMALNEVYYSKMFKRVGLLSPLSEIVSVKLSDQDAIAVYQSKSFQWLAEKENIFVIDMKNRESSTWKRGKDFLFSSVEERLSEKKWLQSLDSLWSDIAILCLHEIPLPLDARNFAVVKNKGSFAQIRLFGFDFSSKQEHLLPPKTLTIKDYRQKMKDMKKELYRKRDTFFDIKRELNLQLEVWEEQAGQIAELGIERFFHYEFPRQNLDQKEKKLLDELIWQSFFMVLDKIKQKCPEFFENKQFVDLSDSNHQEPSFCNDDKHECDD